MTDLSPSAVQSDTIHPHSAVLNGNAPCKKGNFKDTILMTTNIIPYFCADNISCSLEDCQVSVDYVILCHAHYHSNRY